MNKRGLSFIVISVIAALSLAILMSAFAQDAEITEQQQPKPTLPPNLADRCVEVPPVVTCRS